MTRKSRILFAQSGLQIGLSCFRQITSAAPGRVAGLVLLQRQPLVFISAWFTSPPDSQRMICCEGSWRDRAALGQAGALLRACFWRSLLLCGGGAQSGVWSGEADGGHPGRYASRFSVRGSI